MGQKCTKCGCPLCGFLYNLIARPLFGLKPSAKDPSICNKCEPKHPNGPNDGAYTDDEEAPVKCQKETHESD